MHSRASVVSRLPLFALIVGAATAYSQGVITTVAGTEFVFSQGPATSAPIGKVKGVAVDGRGSFYLSSSLGSVVLKVDQSGVASLMAGNGIAGLSGDGGASSSASLSFPNGLAVDAAGNLFIADGGNDNVRKVSPAGIITTVAGGGGFGFSGDGGPASAASLGNPVAVAVDGAGNLFIADNGNHRIRKVSPGGIITTIAGNGTAGFSGDGGPALNAALNAPTDVAVDSAGNVFIADADNGRVRKVTPAGTITTVAGGANAPLNSPRGLAVDAAGNLFISDTGSERVFKLTPSGTISTIAGNGSSGFSGDGGLATNASLHDVSGVAVDSTGNLFIADTENGRVRRVTPAGTISTVAGAGSAAPVGDGGQAVGAYLFVPLGVAADAAGNLFIVDAANNRIRKVSTTGIITTAAGNGAPDFSGDGGPAAAAALAYPSAVAVDAAGSLFIADESSNRIRKVSPAGVITTVAGNGAFDFSGDGGSALNASFSGPAGVAVDATGNLFIADSGNGRVRKVTPAGIITTVAGGTGASLISPRGLAVDAAGNLLIADYGSHRVFKMTPAGIISAVAGNGTADFSGDGGAATSASLYNPSGVAADRAGNVYIADLLNQRIRVVSPSGIIDTVAGRGAPGFSGDGGPATQAALKSPSGVAIDGSGNLFIADTDNNRIREVLSAPASFTTTPATLSFTATSTGAAPPAQAIHLYSPVPGLLFSVQASDVWLTVSPQSGALPVDLQVTVDPSQLAAGNYNSDVTITVPGARPAAQTVAAGLTVTAATPAKLALGNQSLAFSVTQGANSSSLQLTASNQGGGSLAFTASAAASTGGNWLQVTPASGSVTAASPASLSVTATPGTLGAGTYSGFITVVGGDTGQQLTIPVTLAISPSQQKIVLSQTGVTFTAVAQGGTVLPQSIGILNAGSGSMNWTAQASTLSGSGWLSLSATSGTVTQPFLDVSFIDVSVNPRSLAPGNYFGNIQVTAPGASNSPQTVVVVLNVLPAGSNPGPQVRPTGLVFTGAAGAGNPGSQNVMVSNLTANPVIYGSSATFVSAANWFRYVPTNATLMPDSPGQIVVQPDFTGLTPGFLRGALTLAFNDGSIRTVGILSVVAPSSAATSDSAGKEGVPLASGCSPSKLQIQLISSEQVFTAILNQPNSLEVQVVDDCGAPVTTTRGGAAVKATFSSGDPSVNLVHTTNGRWSGTWQPRGMGGAVLAQITAFLVLGNGALYAGQTTLTANLSARAAVPLQSVVLNGASFVGRAPVAPGTLISVFGSGLADQQTADTVPLPTVLGGAQVLLGGQSLPLLYASDGQMNAQVPYGLAENTQLQLQVRRGTALSFPEPITVAPAQPAIFTQNQSGAGQGAIVNVSNVIVDAAAPAAAGETVVIYCTGLGAVDPPVPAGSLAPASPLSKTTNPVTVTIGGVQARVDFAGLTPGTAGLYQVNAVVPPGVAPGGHVPVTLTIAGQTSPAVTMAVR